MNARAEVAIAGGGPAGSACAIELARAGIDVVIVEQAAFPRRKTCGEYLNAGAVRLLDEIGVLGVVRARANRVEKLVMRNRSGASLALPFCGESLAFPRAELDELLAQTAESCGARRMRARVIGPLRDAAGRVRGLSCRGADGEAFELAAAYVVGADGAHSTLATALGMRAARSASRRFAVGGHYRGVAGKPGELEMIVDGNGYLAVNPLDGTRANVMLVLPRDRIAARDGAESFVRREMRAIGGEAFGMAERLGARAGFGPLESFVNGAAVPGFVLAGDAAGMIDPFTGQGVYLALRSGTAAGRALAAALARAGAERELLGRYASDHARDLVLRRRACALVKTIVSTPALASFAAARLSRSPQRAEPLFAAVSGVGRIESAFAPASLLGLVA